MLPANFIARRREIWFPLFLLISIIRKYLYFLRNLKDYFNFDFFEYLNLKKKKEECYQIRYRNHNGPAVNNPV